MYDGDNSGGMTHNITMYTHDIHIPLETVHLRVMTLKYMGNPKYGIAFSFLFDG